MGMKVLKGASAILCGLLLWLVFPPHAQADSVWLALVPLFLVIRHSTPRGAFGWAWLGGAVFWVMTLSWFPAIIKNEGPWPLVLLGQAGLAAWCAVFFGVFAYASALVWRWAGESSGWRRMAAVAAADPLLWAGVEYARGTLLSGFAWNFLGVSQVGNIPLIQVASVVGVYGVSALLVLVNGAAASLIERMAAPLVARFRNVPFVAPQPGLRLLRSAESLLPFALVIGCWIWGLARTKEWTRAEAQATVWRIALVQPNSPCIFAINDDTVRSQQDLLVNQTRLAGAAKPDLVVWPETAVLGSVPYEPQTMKLIREGAAAAGSPLLTGTLEIERTQATPVVPEGLFFYNAAWLFSATGEAMGRYRKQHLVPFGEYIPLDKTIPILQRLAPTGVSCTPGRDPGVLHLAKRTGGVLSMGPLICFEDTVPRLSRAAIRAGANLLVLMTNDAWFNGSIEPVQHLSQSVFRAVENGVPMVRAANSGVSCVVDAVGRVTRLESKGAAADFSGFMVARVAVPAHPLASPYTRVGDWLLAAPGLLLTLALTLFSLAAGLQERRRNRRMVQS